MVLDLTADSQMMMDYALPHGPLSGISLGMVEPGTPITRDVGICFIAEGKFEFTGRVRMSGGRAKGIASLRSNHAEISIVVVENDMELTSGLSQC